MDGRRILAGAALALAALIVAPARADAPVAQPTAPARVDGVRVGDGDRLVLSVEYGAPRVTAKTALKDDDVFVPQLDTKVETVETLRGAHLTAEPGTLVASFRNLGAKGAVLRLENGLDHPILYDAVIISDGPDGPRTARTTICPVMAGKIGLEGWPGTVKAVLISNVRTPPPGDMRCTGDTGLVNDASLAPANVCNAGKPMDPVSVRLYVDPATGERRNAEAVWTLHDAAAGSLAPWLLLGFPMQGDRVAGRPAALQVLAIVGLQPFPAPAKAEIVISADGREVARRPWQLYAQQHAALANAPADKRPVAFVGSIPFPLRGEGGALQPGLVDLFDGIGDGRVKTAEVRIVGDDGAGLGHAAYVLGPPPVRDPVLVAAALQASEALATAPTHCARPVAPPH